VFERLDSVPPDPILGLIERFRDDPSPDKVDLGVGVYRDESGRTPIMAAVREAARLEVESSSSKAYFGQAGNPEINPVLQDLILGPEHPASIARRAITLQTPGGSGALRVAAELLVEANPDVRMWVPSPTWANHVPLLGSAGIQLEAYPYYDRAIVARDAMLGTLETAQEGDVILVHGSCHNPTGADLTTEDFRALASIAMARRIPVLVDSAYQGFAQGLEEDAGGARILVEAGLEVLICTSFSKNFGLYRDRAGALTVAGPSSQTTQAAYSNALKLVRTMYSVPPDHGPSLVSRVLTTPGLRQRWETELDHMRTRLFSLRAKLVGALRERGRADFDFIAEHRGMFSLLGIDEETATSLVEDHHVYLPSNGRINVAGISDANVERVADAIVAVTAKN
ncbi:MAG: amino acid aminotransferase, partial [Acidimicrobiia bacterium]